MSAAVLLFQQQAATGGAQTRRTEQLLKRVSRNLLPLKGSNLHTTVIKVTTSIRPQQRAEFSRSLQNSFIKDSF
jgi:hypothetical protein